MIENIILFITLSVLLFLFPILGEILALISIVVFVVLEFKTATERRGDN